MSDEIFIHCAEAAALDSTCARRNVGAVIVRDGVLLASGCNGPNPEVRSCMDKGCIRQKRGVTPGTQQELCYAVHAEQNCLINAARRQIDVQGATLYCTLTPCSVCARLLIASGIREIVVKERYPDHFAIKMLEKAGVCLRVYSGGDDDDDYEGDGDRLLT